MKAVSVCGSTVADNGVRPTEERGLSHEGQSMFRIVEAGFLAPEIKRFVIEAPRIARKRQAGQFVIARVYAHGERIPLTIADGDPRRGTVTLIVQGVGKSSKLMTGSAPATPCSTWWDRWAGYRRSRTTGRSW
jgi:hypothetical protein